MVARVWIVAGLLLISGCCALIYQVAWLREFRLVFGGSTTASAAVLAVFMGGLGLGNLLLGPRADRHPTPLRLYAQLELAIALTCALSPWLIDASRALYAALGGQTALGVGGATVVRLLITVVVLGVPTFLMGGTLPAAVKAVVAPDDAQRRAVGLVYGMNTLGAVLGTLLSTFLLLPSLGTRMTLWLACVMNVLLAFAAWRASLAPALATMMERRRMRKRQKREVWQATTDAVPPAFVPSSVIFASAFVTGCAFFLMELVWYRMLTPLLGGSTFNFGLILATALAGVGFGGALYPLLFRHRAPAAWHFALTCALQSIAIGIPYALGDRFALWSAGQLQDNTTFGQMVGAWLTITSGTIFPAALVSGVQFPLLIGLLGRGNERVGQQVGTAVACNTLGCIAGSLAGGFGLMPLLTAPGVWMLVIGLTSCTALAWLLVAWRQAPGRLRFIAPAACAALALLMLFATGPTAVWRHTSIGAGRSPFVGRTVNEIRFGKHQLYRATYWQADGVESSLAIRGPESLSLYVNGKSDGDSVGDAATQIMLGMVPAVLHAQPRTALVVGLGTGETAGWLAAIPDIERVDCVELEPQVAEMARRCAIVNHDVLNNPKLRLIINDGRESLTSTPATYDLIVSEPSNPYRAGVANLFTREFYQAVRQRLNEGGLFGQWMQSYEVDDETIGIVLNTLRQEFPHVELWHLKQSDLLIVASAQPPEYNVTKLRARLAEQPYRDALRIAWRAEGVEGFLSGYVGGPSFVAHLTTASRGKINTDDHNRLEYAFAKTVGSQSFVSVLEWRNDAITRKEQRPAVNGDVDWERVVDHYLLTFVADNSELPFVAGLNKAQTSRWRSWNARRLKQLPQSIEFWYQQKRSPETSTELVALASAMLKGDERAEGLIEQLRAKEPIEADALMAMLAFRDGENDVAAKYCERVFVALRTDPWSMETLMWSALDLSTRLGHRNKPLAKKLYEILDEPFAAHFADKERHAALLALAQQVGGETLVHHLETYEPYPPWDEGFLRLRAATYVNEKHPRAAQAERELQEFQRLSHSPR
jgi:spermidine synthase